MNRAYRYLTAIILVLTLTLAFAPCVMAASSEEATCAVGEWFEYEAAFVNAVTVTDFTCTGSIPAGMTVTEKQNHGGVSIVLSGRAQSAGVYDMTFSSPSGMFTDVLLTLTVTGGTAGAQLPSIFTYTLPAGVVGMEYSAYIEATGTAPIEIGEYYNPGHDNNMPPGLRLSSTGNGHLKGTPTKAGVYTFSVYAANDAGEDYHEYTLTIYESDPGAVTMPTITTKSLPEGTVGVEYSFYIKATGDIPITIEQYYDPGQENDIPPGLRLSSSGSGHVKGTPTKAGKYTFCVCAANGAGEDYRVYTLVIKEGEKPAATPEQTAAPQPTDTPQPTETPMPTETPAQTETPEPTDAPVQTEQPEQTVQSVAPAETASTANAPGETVESAGEKAPIRVKTIALASACVVLAGGMTALIIVLIRRRR